MEAMDNALKNKSSSSPISLPGTISKDTLLGHLTQGTLRLVLGENHFNPEAVDFLIKNMSYLKGKTLALEGICYERHQTLLDEWIKKPLDTPLPVELTFAKQDNILYAAKENGVKRILALDAESIASNAPIVERLKSMNYIAHKIITHEIDPKESFIALVGAYHASETTIVYD